MSTLTLLTPPPLLVTLAAGLGANSGTLPVVSKDTTDSAELILYWTALAMSVLFSFKTRSWEHCLHLHGILGVGIHCVGLGT